MGYCFIFWAFPPLGGQAFRFNLLLVPHKRISTAILNAGFSFFQLLCHPELVSGSQDIKQKGTE